MATNLLLFSTTNVPLNACEVVGCGDAASRMYPTDRRVCRKHLLVWIGTGFWGCGCGPQPCASCARHLASGRRVPLVGERENRPGWAHDDEERHLENVKFHHDRWGDAGVLAFFERAGALRWGSSKGRLLGLGLRWDNAVNLLGPSARPGAWDTRAARQGVNHIQGLAMGSYDAVVLLGSKVKAAWGAPSGKARVVCLPHPSGRNRLWNDPAVAARCRAEIDALYIGEPKQDGPEPGRMEGVPETA